MVEQRGRWWTESAAHTQELYYVLLSYKVLIDWNNWNWLPKSTAKKSAEEGREDPNKWIVVKCKFVWYWLITTAALVYWAYRNSQYLREIQKKATAESVSQYFPWGGWIGALVSVIVVILLQVKCVLEWYLGTLKVTISTTTVPHCTGHVLGNLQLNLCPIQIEKFLLPFNQFLEDGDGILRFEQGADFINAIRGVVSEDRLQAWTMRRWLEMPSRGLFGDKRIYNEKLELWKARCADDMDLLLTQSADFWRKHTSWTKYFYIFDYYFPSQTAFKVRPLPFVFVVHYFTSKSNLSILSHAAFQVLAKHPAFSEIRSAARHYSCMRRFATLVAMCVTAGVEFYAFYLIACPSGFESCSFDSMI